MKYFTVISYLQTVERRSLYLGNYLGKGRRRSVFCAAVNSMARRFFLHGTIYYII